MWSHTDTDQFISLWISLQVDNQSMLKHNKINKKKKLYQLFFVAVL